MENKTWYNIAVFIKEKSVAALLQMLHFRLLEIYRDQQDLHYFFCLDSSRGPGVVLYLEHIREKEETILNFYYSLVQAINHSGEFDITNDLLNKNESSIFKDISCGQVCYGLFKLKAIPFTHFSADDRHGYFLVLKAVSTYLLARTENEQQHIIKNKFLFCFSLIYKACSRQNAIDDRFMVEYKQAIDSELERVSITVGKPFKEGLYKTYEKNRAILDRCINDEGTDNIFFPLFSGKDFSNIIGLVSDKMTRVCHKSSGKLFVLQICTDICSILNLSNYLTCLFFVQECINENLKNGRSQPDEKVIKK